jgi:hypothetical protein
MFTSTVRAVSVSAWLALAGVLVSAPAATPAASSDAAAPSSSTTSIKLTQ